MSLCSILNVSDVVLVAPFNKTVVAHLTKKMDGDDGFGSRCACGFKRSEVNAPMGRLHVNKNRVGSHQGDAGCRGNVGQGGDQHLVTRANAQKAKRAPKSDGTALTRRALNGVAIRRKLLAERFALWPFHPVQGVQRF